MVAADRRRLIQAGQNGGFCNDRVAVVVSVSARGHHGVDVQTVWVASGPLLADTRGGGTFPYAFIFLACMPVPVHGCGSQV